MAIAAPPQFPIVAGSAKGRDVAALHGALAQLRLPVAPGDQAGRRVGLTTQAAIAQVQTAAGLPVTGVVDGATAAAVQAQADHAFYARSKTRTARLQALLGQAGFPVDAAESKARTLGPATTAAIQAFQQAQDLPADGQLQASIVQRLAAAALAAQLSTKTQVAKVQRMVLIALKRSGVQATVDAAELRGRQLGATSQAAISALQQHYKLPVTGTIDPATYDRLVSVVASRPQPAAQLSVGDGTVLRTLPRALRLNMTNADVPTLQHSLAFLGYPVDDTEVKAATFGASTRLAVIAFQKAHQLPVDGHVTGATRAALNEAISQANPAAAQSDVVHVRGSVRDERWAAKAGVTVEVWETGLRSDGTRLAARKTFANGFFDVPFPRPADLQTGQPKASYQVLVKVLDAAGAELSRKTIVNPPPITWSNFTDGALPYRAAVEYDTRLAAVTGVLGATPVTSIEESDAHQDLSFVAARTGQTLDDVMRLALAHRVAAAVATPAITPEVVYAFVRQHLPPALPGDLLAATAQWAAIDALVENTARALVFLDPAQQESVLTAAAAAGLVGPQVALGAAATVTALGELKLSYALAKPLLPGNGSLQDVLSASTVPPAAYPAVAAAFVTQRGLGEDFWSELSASAATYGGADAVADLRLTAQLADIARHFVPVTTFLKTTLGAGTGGLTKISDLATLDAAGWAGLIAANGAQVPDSMPGATAADKAAAYAGAMAAQAERLFPSVSLAAAVGRAGGAGLARIGDAQAFLGDHPDLDLMVHNVDKYLQTASVSLDAPVLADVKALQRLNRIAPTSAVAAAAATAGITSATQVAFVGRERTIGQLTAAGVAAQVATTVANRAETQYAQALSLLTDYHFGLHRADPAAIISHTWTLAEQQAAIGDVPDLETLFGSLGYCECGDCQSLLSPAAYFVDILRFLTAQPSQTAGQTVADVLLARRPDLANITLGCRNTEVVLPYIDLVCEVLEAAVSGAPGFSYQSDGDQAELRAFPANVDAAVYDQLRTADHPLTPVFDLWQAEARAWLGLLGAPRWSLMQTLQVRPVGGPDVPSGVDVAAEFLGLCSHEADLVTTPADAAALGNIWQFDASRATIGARELMTAGSLDYGQLVVLVELGWVNAASDGPAPMSIDTSASACDPDQQAVVNCTPERLDRLHRFIRLWRHGSWQAWQLDLLLRAPAVTGADAGQTLAGLAGMAQLQARLGVDPARAAAMVADLDTLAHRDPADLTTQVPSLYAQVFQSAAVTDPVDVGLALPLDSSQTLTAHGPAIMAALAIGADDFAAITAQVGDVLAVPNLSAAYRVVTLAGALRLTVAQLLTLLGPLGASPFGSPAALAGFLDDWAVVTATGLTVDEVAYLLLRQPDAPQGLRDDAIADFLTGLRDALKAAPPEQVDGQAVSAVAAQFAVPTAQARVLLESLAPGGATLLAALTDPALTALAPDGSYQLPASRAVLPTAFAAADLLRKAVLLLGRLKVTGVDDTSWLLASAGNVGALQLADLPVTADPAASLLPALTELARWAALRAAYPEPDTSSLRAVLDCARATDGAGQPASTPADVLGLLAALVQVDPPTLAGLASALSLQLTAARNDYLDLRTYGRLADGVSLLRRLGVDAATAAGWAARQGGPATPATIAAQVRQAAKARSDYAAWLAAATPIMDDLREGKRDALVAHLLDVSAQTQPPTVTVDAVTWPNPLYWRDSDDLLRHFLIDVEMSSCQLTTRVKQATSSAQMFVQRCLLNVERPAVQVGSDELSDQASLNAWSQWRWMKSYRLWVPARQVFFWPENWITPELRDDKSPFFEELESELAQSDLTSDLAQAALQHYLEKVNAVRRLDVLGVYHEIDDDDSIPDTDRLHVVARTHADPAVYYYRAFDLLAGSWSAWQKIDVDITGDHLMPVVYNRKLHLFWLSILRKPQKVSKQPPARQSASATPDDAAAAPQQLELQLSWTVQTADGWTPKQVSRERLVHPWERPDLSYTIKPRYKSRENQLWIDLFITTSPEFNNTPGYDPFTGTRRVMTKTRASETMRPWHSSSFVFDGAVIAAKMRALRGNYHLIGPDGSVGDTATFTTSWDYVHTGFSDVGRAIGFLDGPYENAPRLPLPDGLHYQFNRLTNNIEPATANTRRVAVLENGTTRQLLDLDPNPAQRSADFARGPFELIFSQDHIAFDAAAWGLEPFLYQDDRRSYFVTPEPHVTQLSYNTYVNDRAYRFRSFYHPYTALFLRELARGGVAGLLNRSVQSAPQTYFPGNSFSFDATYHPVAPSYADPGAAADIVDFDRSSAYAIYNWETFFHIPFLIATRLSANEKFEDALGWFHYVFDPTNVQGTQTPQRFWVTKPFADTNSDDYRQQRIENLLADIGANLGQLQAWRNDPYNPFLIARFRPVAFQKTVVMRYLDNLVTWGDRLFAQDTLEAINEATMLYVLAQELLGPAPEAVPSTGHADRSWHDLVTSGTVDAFGQASVTVALENLAAPPSASPNPSPASQPLPVIVGDQYFCVPPNTMLLAYWPTVADRLFKIRHCMNLAGIVRQLPVYETPIDPALLVKAAAAGVDLDSVVSPSAAQGSEYRYRVLQAKAEQLCAQVQALGDKTLSVLEKRDAEQLALLRAANESAVLQASLAVHADQIDDARHQVDIAQKAKDTAEQRRAYYQSRDLISLWEGTALALSGTSALAETAIAVGYILAGGLKLIPNFVIGASGFGGTPHAVAGEGGQNIGDAADNAVKTLQAGAAALDKFATLAATMGSYQRRMDDWNFQADLAVTESSSADIAILTAQVRQALAEHQLDVLNVQIDTAAQVSDYLTSKFTSQQLYEWMLGQLATVYFQAYTQAVDMAKRAEAALARELGRTDLTFIQFGYWDGLRKGLLAGERLASDLARMDAAYLRYHTRELELTKHVSMAQFMPLSLLALKTAGTCTVTLPEWIYDLDYPGHYRRRIVSVAVTIPCVAGPWSGVHATLTLTANAMRATPDVAGSYGNPLVPAGDARFVSNPVTTTTIATSSGQNDTGTFELSFGDERFLPFEGAGAVSLWTMTLAQDGNAFDLSTITDVILHVRYQASMGTPELATQAAANLSATLPTNGMRLLALKNEFGTAWARFLTPAPGADQVLAFTLTTAHLPFYVRNQTATVTSVGLFVDTTSGDPLECRLTAPAAPAPQTGTAVADAAFGGLHHVSLAVHGVPVTGDWQLSAQVQGAADWHSLDPLTIGNVYLVISFALA